MPLLLEGLGKRDIGSVKKEEERGCLVSCVLFSLLPAHSRLKQLFEAWSFVLLGPACGAIRFGGRKKRHSGKGMKLCSARQCRVLGIFIL